MIVYGTATIRKFIRFINDFRIPPVSLFIIPGHPCLETPSGDFCFACYVPAENRILVAEGVDEEVDDGVLLSIAHEYYHHIQRSQNKPYDESEAENWADKMVEKFRRATS